MVKSVYCSCGAPGFVPRTQKAAFSDPIGLLHPGGSHIHSGTHIQITFFLWLLDEAGEHFHFSSQRIKFKGLSHKVGYLYLDSYISDIHQSSSMFILRLVRKI